MFLRFAKRYKDGKEHRYWSVVENRRAGKRVVQRPVLYLGGVNDSQREAWREAVSVFDEDTQEDRQIALYPADRDLPTHAVGCGVRLDQMVLRHPRCWGDCWLALHFWEQLELEGFWRERLTDSREGTDWVKVLQVLLANCWRDLFNADYEVLLYDLTSTYFESDPFFEDGDKRRFGYSRDKRSDCVQIVIALVVTPDSFPLAYEVLPGNTIDNQTLRDILARIQRQYGKAKRLWLMDRGIPTEEVLAGMRAPDPPGQYLVGTPKGRLTRLEGRLLEQPWRQARDGVDVKLLAEDGETYVLARSRARAGKEHGMRNRHLRRYLKKLRELRLERKHPMTRELNKGRNLLRFTRKSEGSEKGFSIKDFTLTPVSK